MMMPFPTRHDEYIVRSPWQHCPANRRPAATLDHLVDRAVSGAVWYSAESAPQQLSKGSHRRHRVVAGERIDVTGLHSVARILIARASERPQRFPCICIRIIQQRRTGSDWFVIDRQDTAAIARPRISFQPV